MKISCLIPFFNEAGRIKPVLRVVAECPEINQVVCVNDGSTDETSQIIQKNFPQFELLNLKTNQGKTGAIKIGLKKIKSEAVLLIDADLRRVKKSEITRAIKTFRSNNLDMLILRRVDSILPTKLFRGDFLFTGERIIKTQDLKQILKKNFKAFQIEAAINDYCLRQKKKIAWIPFSALSTYKIYKRGLLKGLLGEMDMSMSIYKYLGLRSYLRQYFYSFGIPKYI